MHVAKFCSLEWITGNNAEFITRKPGEKKPTAASKEYRRNPDGTIVYMVPKPAIYRLTLRKEDGTLISEDVYGIIKYYKHNVRITKNFRAKFEEFMSTRCYCVEDNGFIKGVYDGVEEFLRCYN